MPSLGKKRNLQRIKHKRRPTSDRAFYHSPGWRALRRVQLAVSPICEVHESIGRLVDCTKGHPIDHIVPISRGGSRTHNLNLMTLCVSCHDNKSRLEARHGCMVETVGEDGFKVPAPGEKEKLIQKLAESIL